MTRSRHPHPRLWLLVAFAVLFLGSLAVSAQDEAPVSPLQHRSDSSVAPAPTPLSADSTPKPSVTVLEDTLIRVRTNESINSKREKHGTPVLFTVSEDTYIGDTLGIPRGAIARGVVLESRKSGVLTGSPELILQLDSLEFAGHTYPVITYQFKVHGTSKTGPTKTSALRGAAVGAIAGSLIGSVSAKSGVAQAGASDPASISAGAVVGAGVGTAVSALSPGPGIWIPSESQVDFYLAAPITVAPVTPQQAARLAQGLHSGGPSLYVRGDIR